MISDGILNGIRAFVQAADSGSFSLAAERLGLSRSAVGKSIARLEGRLNVRLFNRTTRKLSLTNDGHSFYQSCVRAMSELEIAESALASRRQSPSGRLRIDLPVVFGHQCIMPILLEISDRYPELNFDVSFNNRRVDLIEEGIDIIIRIGHLEDSTGLVARLLGVQKMKICGSPSYFDKHGRPQDVEELSKHKCITYSYSGRISPWLFQGADGQNFSKIFHGRFRFGSGDSIADAAIAGHGLCQLPTWLVASYIKNGDLELVLEDFETNGFPIHAIWPQVRHLAPKVRVVVDELMKQFLPVPPWDIP